MTRTASLALLLTTALLLGAKQAVAGAVYEIREPANATAQNNSFIFNDITTVPGLGSISRSGLTGAGAFYRTSAVPMAIYTLERCASVALHIHPNGAEQLFVVVGSIRVVQYRGEEAGNNITVNEVPIGQGVYIQQGSIHYVENTFNGTSLYLQIFDHPQAGTVFVGPAIATLPRNIVNSQFSTSLPSNLTAVPPPLVRIQNCTFTTTNSTSGDSTRTPLRL